MRTVALALASAVVWTSAVALPASACSCPPPPPPKQSLDRSAAVFAGKVVQIERPRDGLPRVTFEVDRTWKGVDGKTVVVETADTTCGYHFEKGKSYVVYAVTAADTKTLYTSICHRTRRVDEAKEDFRDLGEGKRPGDRK